MKNVELKDLTVQEMEEVNGGFLFTALVIIAAVAFVAGQCIGLANGYDPETGSKR